MLQKFTKGKKYGSKQNQRFGYLLIKLIFIKLMGDTTLKSCGCETVFVRTALL